MKFEKLSINSSPYIGVYGRVDNELGLFPDVIKPEQKESIERTLGIRVIDINIGEALVNGSTSVLHNGKVLLAKSSKASDVKVLEKEGLEVLKLSTSHAVGNLVAINDKALLLSEEFSLVQAKRIAKFFDLEYNRFNFGEIEVVGSAVSMNNSNIALSPNMSKEDIEKVTNMFKVEGNIGTVNYGDPFLGNGLLVNDKGVLMGDDTTGYEIIRLDDIFG